MRLVVFVIAFLAFLCDTSSANDGFKKSFFASWGIESRADAVSALEDSSSFDVQTDWYGENLMPINKNAFYELVSNAKAALKRPIFKNAITLQNADLRSLPTKTPLFKNPSLAGEGYPFDNLQESRIYISTPIKILYISKDGDYCYIKSPVGYGWLDTKSVALVDRHFERVFKKSKLVTPIIDKKPLYGAKKRFIERLNIGTVMPEGMYPVLSSNGYAKWKKYAKTGSLELMPMKITTESIALSAYGLYGEPYGWGGYLDNRDCSMFLRDIFVGFGVYLPRNSAQQAKGYTDINAKSTEEKKQYILAYAKPFRTLIYLKGHIMLYVGKASNDEPLVMHDVWGIKSFENGKEGRKMLGGIVVTTMEEGKGEPWFDENKSSILAKALGIKDIY